MYINSLCKIVYNGKRLLCVKIIYRNIFCQ